MREEFKKINELTQENSKLKEKIESAIKVCKTYNRWDSNSMSWTLSRLRGILEE